MPFSKSAELRRKRAERLNHILLESSRLGRTKRVKRLLDAGLLVDTRSWENTTPLIFAASNGRLDTVSLLLEKGADINAMNNSGECPLTRAAEHGKVLAVMLLLGHGAENESLAIQLAGLFRQQRTVAALNSLKPLRGIMGKNPGRFLPDFVKCAGI